MAHSPNRRHENKKEPAGKSVQLRTAPLKPRPGLNGIPVLLLSLILHLLLPLPREAGPIRPPFHL